MIGLHRIVSAAAGVFLAAFIFGAAAVPAAADAKAQGAAGSESPNLLWKQIDLHFDAGKDADLTVTISRSAPPLWDRLHVALRSRTYEIGGKELEFMAYPQIANMVASVENYDGNPTVTLIVPYFDQAPGSAGATPKLAYIVMLNMKSHRIQHP